MKLELNIHETDIFTISNKILKKYQDGWHMADLLIRRDGKEERIEADWLYDVFVQINKQAKIQTKV